jgi:hypothetical protein
MECLRCYQCKTEKMVSEFSKAKNSRGYQNNCKPCQAQNARAHYRKNKDKKIKNTLKWNEQKRDWNYSFVYRWMRRFATCIDCGYGDIRALEFDHVRGEKYKGVKDMCHKTASIKRIKDEIRKCEIRCCNCHRIKTQKQFNQRTSKWSLAE